MNTCRPTRHCDLRRRGWSRWHRSCTKAHIQVLSEDRQVGRDRSASTMNDDYIDLDAVGGARSSSRNLVVWALDPAATEAALAGLGAAAATSAAEPAHQCDITLMCLPRTSGRPLRQLHRDGQAKQAVSKAACQLAPLEVVNGRLRRPDDDRAKGLQPVRIRRQHAWRQDQHRQRSKSCETTAGLKFEGG